jgi:ribosomal protein L12E/L44/L45/RPP1/RPP2
MIETVFLISLAITFVLILLMVYHFNQRLGALESASDSMCEIIQSLVRQPRMCGAPAPQGGGCVSGAPGLDKDDDEEEDDEDEDEDEEDDDDMAYSADDAVNMFADDANGVKKISIPSSMNPADIANMFVFHSTVYDPAESGKYNMTDIDDDEDDDEDDYADMPELEDIYVGEDVSLTLDGDVVEFEAPPVTADAPLAAAPASAADVDADEGDDDVDESFRETETDADAPSTAATPNYAKQSVHQLRMVAASRGFAVDVNKLKKPELVKLLSSA